ncbi:hypothetical protein NEOLI_001739 [Neolecta irregularis DAH-3]|uniref:Uncharacterized protein n=1 Tax=Neolecta irregularis (strain DAH-3) TaxID=1198029 RepID=A0A1U7LW89_NEOID|nr:hypothetical protein NEOLI_001739 [Neolecta irregularis DAH-3]|eukprot:OLL26771.1 hypothetical protein NEOLI_001739 [Neolecta irregularis DAH-3]
MKHQLESSSALPSSQSIETTRSPRQVICQTSTPSNVSGTGHHTLTRKKSGLLRWTSGSKRVLPPNVTNTPFRETRFEKLQKKFSSSNKDFKQENTADSTFVESKFEKSSIAAPLIDSQISPISTHSKLQDVEYDRIRRDLFKSPSRKIELVQVDDVIFEILNPRDGITKMTTRTSGMLGLLDYANDALDAFLMSEAALASVDSLDAVGDFRTCSNHEMGEESTCSSDKDEGQFPHALDEMGLLSPDEALPHADYIVDSSSQSSVPRSSDRRKDDFFRNVEERYVDGV